jgi:hypothetical protein
MRVLDLLDCEDHRGLVLSSIAVAASRPLAAFRIARAASSQTRGGIDSWCIVVSEPLKDVHRLIPLRFVSVSYFFGEVK